MWAAIAKKAAPVEQPVDALPKQVVIAPTDEAAVPKLNGVQHELDNVFNHTIINLPEFHKGLLVLDTNAFIKGMDHLLDVVDCIVTVAQVIQEIRDRSSKDFLDRLPLKLHVLEPTKDSILEVMAIAKKTGDDGAMSRTDIRLAALAVDCCKAHGCRLPMIEPRAPRINPCSADVKTRAEEIDDEELEDDDNQDDGDLDDEEEAEGEASPATEGGDEGKQQPVVEAQRDEDDWGEDGDAAVGAADDDDEGEWITPENITKVVNGTAKHDGVLFSGGVACVTSDFAMQNTLLHLGVPIVGPRGMHIRELRLWLLRCHACFRVVTDTTRQFCPDCGSGDTLRRVNYVVNDKGEKQLFINFSRRISTRGTIFNLPRPRGGKRGTNRTLALREDQLAHVLKGKSSSQDTKLQQVLEGDDELAVFGLPQAKKKFDVNAPRVNSSYKRFNVNEQKKARAGRRR